MPEVDNPASGFLMKNISLFCLLLLGCSAKPTPSEKALHFEEPKSISSAVVVEAIEDNKHEGMVHVVGEYCTKIEERCLRYKEDPSTTKFARCLEFAPTTCIGPKVHMDYWMDKFEHKEDHTRLPMSDVTWTKAKSICESEGKRLPTEEEWEFACAGEDNHAYSGGFIRPTAVCNMDIEKNVVCGKKVCDYRKDIDANPECKSVFGVVNMAGSVDEWTISKPYQHSKQPGFILTSSLRGGHYLPVRNMCHKATHDHEGLYFSQVTIGFRCSSN